MKCRFLLLALALAVAACSRSLDESFPWGAGGAPFDPEAAIQELLASGGGYAGTVGADQKTIVVVFDALTGNAISGATVVVGIPPSNHFVFYTDGSGRVTYVHDENWFGVEGRVVSAGLAGYETLTVDHGANGSWPSPAVYVLPLRPNTSAAYARLHAKVQGLSTSDHRKFEASHTNSVMPFFQPLDQEGFAENDTGVFFGPPNRPGTCAALELASDRAYRIVTNDTYGTGAGSVENQSVDLNYGISSPVALGGGGDFYLQGNYSNPNELACRARVLAFQDGAPQPLIVGSDPVNVFSMYFKANAFPLPNVVQHRGQLHFEDNAGPADVYWDLPLDLYQAGTTMIDLPPHPSLSNPPNGRKLTGPSEAFEFYWYNWSVTGLFEVVIRDPMKSFPENMAWRIWKGAWDNDGSAIRAGYLRFAQNEDALNLQFEREYTWRAIRHEDTTFTRGGTCRYGTIPRTARYSSYSPWWRFTIGLDGQADSAAVDKVIEDLRAKGGGVAGIPWTDGSVSVKVLVFDESTGSPISGADVFLEHNPAYHIGTTGPNGRVSPFQLLSNRVITACCAGYENTTFYAFNGHVLAIPLRPLSPTAWPRLSGTINGLSSPDMPKGTVSVLHATLNEVWPITGSVSETYDLPALPFKPLAMAALLTSSNHLSEFRWLTPPTLTGTGATTFDFDFTGTSTHAFAQLDSGATGLAYKPWNLSTVGFGRAWVLGKGVDSSQAWKTLSVGCGYVNTGSLQYFLDSAKVPQVRGLKGCVGVGGTEGFAEARFGVPSLARSLPDLSFPDLPSLYSPSNGGGTQASGPYLEFFQSVSDETSAGPCTLFIEDTLNSPPLCFKWRVFVFPTGNTYVYLPILQAPYTPYELMPATTYRWFVRAYRGGYFLRDGTQSQYMDLGKFSLGWLEEFAAFRSDSQAWTFTTGGA